VTIRTSIRHIALLDTQTSKCSITIGIRCIGNSRCEKQRIGRVGIDTVHLVRDGDLRVWVRVRVMACVCSKRNWQLATYRLVRVLCIATTCVVEISTNKRICSHFGNVSNTKVCMKSQLARQQVWMHCTRIHIHTTDQAQYTLPSRIIGCSMWHIPAAPVFVMVQSVASRLPSLARCTTYKNEKWWPPVGHFAFSLSEACSTNEILAPLSSLTQAPSANTQ
jgi:hypothetical protein